ncbi:unnamed protein product [Acanthosepion pharaonis]|uniref:Uncharacterized protein n=1 Tax=Acanthosepion pharaonis TaxID=158019 RepID=A0A812DK81_ACAPH|nr:unnamed protein product [Sepia pharaonis]
MAVSFFFFSLTNSLSPPLCLWSSLFLSNTFSFFFLVTLSISFWFLPLCLLYLNLPFCLCHFLCFSSKSLFLFLSFFLSCICLCLFLFLSNSFSFSFYISFVCSSLFAILHFFVLVSLSLSLSLSNNDLINLLYNSLSPLFVPRLCIIHASFFFLLIILSFYPCHSFFTIFFSSSPFLYNSHFYVFILVSLFLSLSIPTPTSVHFFSLSQSLLLSLSFTHFDSHFLLSNQFFPLFFILQLTLSNLCPCPPLYFLSSFFFSFNHPLHFFLSNSLSHVIF